MREELRRDRLVFRFPESEGRGKHHCFFNTRFIATAFAATYLASFATGGFLWMREGNTAPIANAFDKSKED